MAVSTVQLNGVTLMTVNDTTATASDVAIGEYFYTANGTKTEGTGSVGADYMTARLTNAEVLELSNSSVTSLMSFALSRWSALKAVDLPNVTSVGTQSMSYCSGLTRLFFPNLTSIPDTSAFISCTRLKTVVFVKSVSSTGGTAFGSCTNLESFDTRGGRIAGNDFKDCSKLAMIVIRSSSTMTLAATSAFTGTPFASGGSGGTLYVPNDLISSYQSASNWSTILGYANNQIKSIESTHTDPDAPIDLTLYYADGTLIPTT